MEEMLLLLEDAILHPKMGIIISIVLIVFSSVTNFIVLRKKEKNIKDICKDCLYLKIGWLLGLLLGFIIYRLLNVKIIIILVALSCVIKEFKTILSNFKILGVDFSRAEELMKERSDV